MTLDPVPSGQSRREELSLIGSQFWFLLWTQPRPSHRAHARYWVVDARYAVSHKLVLVVLYETLIVDLALHWDALLISIYLSWHLYEVLVRPPPRSQLPFYPFYARLIAPTPSGALVPEGYSANIWGTAFPPFYTRATGLDSFMQYFLAVLVSI
ncbi:hypothetical protein B0F90DRAFT_1822283 [Multifurca ochricompacta]|uniref:Uncharacterized protein n=1 Tax=Multifurca ochricompacta TaxID=376703 RepID=A0AAD4QIS1_9AGAM|nr:hypothetical protein B0F90DRAFT_1822283 [Multifurca ochricompacta]